MIYDSRPDTQAHIEKVRDLLGEVADTLAYRGAVHDRSKLEEPEVSAFNEYTPKLRDSTYGSDEYKGFLVGMGDALNHHYANNRHHPEYHPNGIRDMTLVDLIEMLADWKAATLRHADGDLARSIAQNRERFGYDEHMERLLLQTAEWMGWT
jgi:hypothetical protein